MNGYVLAIAIAIGAIGLLAAAGQTARLSKANVELAQTEATLVDVRAKLERANESRVAVETALAAERNGAVAAEQEAGSLREQIAADADTARDAPTAPVLVDLLKRLRGTR